MQKQSKVEYLRNKIKILTKLGREDEVLNVYDEILKVEGEDSEVRFKKALLYFKNKRIEDAKAECEKAIAADPNRPIYHYGRALALNLLGEYHETISEVNEVLRLIGAPVAFGSREDHSRNVNTELGRLLKHFGDLGTEEQDSEPDIESGNGGEGQEQASTQKQFSRVLLREQSMADVDFNDSIGDAKKLDKALKEIDSHYNRIFSASNQTDRGIEDKEEMFRRFLLEASDPQLEEIFRSYSETVRIDLSGQEARGLKRIDRVLENSPKNPELHYGKALFLYTRGELDDAMREIEIARRLDPLSSAYTFGKTLIENKLLDYEQSIRHLTSAVRENPEDTTLHYKRGLMLYLLKRFGESADEFNNAIDLYQYDPRYYYARSLAKHSLDLAR